ncbi:hypothetical protein RJ640_009790 [Escallonia rubra]|uniref:Uncharacterized protein n=1 Tax=Escallonia rubra TaxID=112253 RepID=A0AA88URQ8_9ASTE|nr:hypothetical protein RJ640_009790 [Escallonia rubra]
MGTQGLNPKSTARLFEKAQCLGEKQMEDEDYFVLKVATDRAAVMERNEGPAEVLRHVLYGYFSQKSGLLIYMKDSHLRVQVPQPQARGKFNNDNSISANNGDTARLQARSPDGHEVPWPEMSQNNGQLLDGATLEHFPFVL